MNGWAGVDHLLTADEVAEVLAASSKRTVQRMRQAGTIRGVRVGRSWRFHPDDVNACIRELRKQGSRT